MRTQAKRETAHAAQKYLKYAAKRLAMMMVLEANDGDEQEISEISAGPVTATLRLPTS